MAMNPRHSSLQRTMIFYFLLIGFAAGLVGMEFVLETRNPVLETQLMTNIEQYVQHEIDAEALLAPLERIRNKALLMVAMVLIVIVIVLTMFIRNITGPLQHMIDVAKEISQGDLSRTIQIDAHNELTELGAGINDLSSNLQEIILHTRHTCRAADRCVARLHEAAALIGDGGGQMQSALADFDNEFKNLGAVVDCFNFYSVEDHGNGR